MHFIIRVFVVFMWAIPMFFIIKGMGQVFQYIIDQTWTSHYAMITDSVVVTDRFRCIDLFFDIVVAFIIYADICMRSKYGGTFTSDLVFHSLVVIFCFEKMVRYWVCGRVF